MQPLNHDMDNLMRKAAEAFEVAPTGADWQKIEAQLDGNEVASKDSSAWAKSRRYGLLMLFLLGSLVCNKYLFKPYGSRLATSNVQAKEKVIEKVVAPATMKMEKLPKKELRKLTGYDDKPYKNVSFSIYPKRSNKQINGNTNHREAVPLNENLKKEKSAVNQISIGKRLTDFDLSNIQQKRLKIPFVNAAPLIIETDNADQIAAENKREKGRFYLGVVAGPDISKVKSQKSSELGYTVGLAGGYQFNKRWAIETGLLWDRKNYYSTGKHFNTSKMNLPSHSNIIYAEGYCNMWEIPLNLRYHFGHGKKHRWFAAAGASSYLMQKEEYHYLYERYNVRYYGSKNYKAASRNWFSVANLSAGYEYSSSKGINFRIEPYLKLPLSGLGIGSLPIKSTGLQLGVTYPIQ